jgi:hypothetical protein
VTFRHVEGLEAVEILLTVIENDLDSREGHGGLGGMEYGECEEGKNDEEFHGGMKMAVRYEAVQLGEFAGSSHEKAGQDDLPGFRKNGRRPKIADTF